MKNRFYLNFLSIAILGFIVTFTSCKQAEKVEEVASEIEAPAAIDMSAIKTEIQAYENEWARLLSEKNIDGLMAMYAEDAISMPPNAPMLTGKEAIKAHQVADFEKMTAGEVFSFETLDVYGDGTTVTEVGKGTTKDAKGAITSTGKYIVVLKKVDGKYMVIREIYNDDAK